VWAGVEGLPIPCLCLKRYINKYHPSLAVEYLYDDKLAKHGSNVQIRKQMYSESYLFEKLHKKLNHRYFTGEDLYSIYNLITSKDSDSMNIGASLIEQMSIEYAPFMYTCNTKAKYHILSRDLPFIMHYADCKIRDKINEKAKTNGRFNPFEYIVIKNSLPKNELEIINNKEYRKYRKEMQHFYTKLKETNKGKPTWI
jgi:hypothetical protein